MVFVRGSRGTSAAMPDGISFSVRASPCQMLQAGGASA